MQTMFICLFLYIHNNNSNMSISEDLIKFVHNLAPVVDARKGQFIYSKICDNPYYYKEVAFYYPPHNRIYTCIIIPPADGQSGFINSETLSTFCTKYINEAQEFLTNSSSLWKREEKIEAFLRKMCKDFPNLNQAAAKMERMTIDRETANLLQQLEESDRVEYSLQQCRNKIAQTKKRLADAETRLILAQEQML